MSDRSVRAAGQCARILCLSALVSSLCGGSAAAIEIGHAPRFLGEFAQRWRETPPGGSLDVIATFQRPLADLAPSVLPWSRRPSALRRAFPAARSVAARLTREEIDALTHLGVVSQWELEGEVHLMDASADAWFGTASARSAFDLTGDGDGDPARYRAGETAIAIIDTGIDAGHVDFSGGKVVAWRDFVNGRSEPYDDNGHGTHVASIAAGSSPSGPTGAAPGAALVGLKALRRDGSGRMSDVAAAIEYCIDQREQLGIRVVNISVGSDTASDGTDLISRLVDQAADAGIVVVVAAGNAGPSPSTIGSPAAAEGAVTVASMADPDRGGFALSSFSSRGPTVDGRVKPDLCAPGEAILAAAAGTVNGYRRFSGTSMAAPFVAGVAALMIEANPALTAREIKANLEQTAADLGAPGKDSDYGAGRLDAYRAITAASGRIAASPVSLPASGAVSGTLAAGETCEYSLSLTTLDYPIAVTLLIANWTEDGGPDFDLYLLDSSRRTLATSVTDQRQEEIRGRPSRTGVYILQVQSRTGAGTFTLDVSGAHPVPLTTE